MAAPRQDLKITDNDVVFENNDFKIAFSDEQHVIDTINAFPGWWKEDPLDGVGVPLFLGSTNTDIVLIREIKVQLDSDGYNTTQTQIVRDTRDTVTIYPNATLR